MGTVDERFEQRIEQLAALEELPEKELEEIQKIITESDEIQLPPQLEHEPSEPPQVEPEAKAPEKPQQQFASEESGGHSDDIRNLLAKANLPQKIKFALFGNATCRLLLIRDANRMIQEFVLKNPRMQIREIEEFARDSNMSQHVLRRIAESQTWMKEYKVKFNIVSNPKTPGDLSLKWLRFLNLPDLKRLARSKNVAQVVSAMARKKLNEVEQKKH